MGRRFESFRAHQDFKAVADFGGVDFGHPPIPRTVSTRSGKRFALSISREISPVAPSGRPSCPLSAGRQRVRSSGGSTGTSALRRDEASPERRRERLYDLRCGECRGPNRFPAGGSKEEAADEPGADGNPRTVSISLRDRRPTFGLISRIIRRASARLEIGNPNPFVHFCGQASNFAIVSNTRHPHRSPWSTIPARVLGRCEVCPKAPSILKCFSQPFAPAER